jgi:hypothetical protein
VCLECNRAKALRGRLGEGSHRAVHTHLVPGPGAGIHVRREVVGSEGHDRTEAAGMVRGIRREVEGRVRHNDRPVVRLVGERHTGLVAGEGHHSDLVEEVGSDPVEEVGSGLAEGDIGLAEGGIDPVEGDIDPVEGRHKAEAGVADSPGADHLEVLAVRVRRREVLLSRLARLC